MSDETIGLDYDTLALGRFEKGNDEKTGNDVTDETNRHR